MENTEKTEKTIKGSEIILEVLKRIGVEDIFGYPGGAVIPIYDALYDFEGLNHYLVRHEQGASHMADAYARVKKNSVGVCIATSGPGATNLVTGLMTAHIDSIPILAITGQVGSTSLGKDAFQESHVLGITAPITKHNYLIDNIEKLPGALKEAYELTKVGRPGPVLIDVTKDVQLGSMSYSHFEELYNKENNFLKEKYHLNLDNNKLDTFVEMLKSAKRPVIVAGGGVLRSDSSSELLELIKRSGIPSVSTLMGLGAIPNNTDGYLGMIGMHGSKEANMCVHEADLFISVGMRFSDRIVGNPKYFARDAKKIHIDIDDAEINKIVVVDLAIVSDAKVVLENILNYTDLGDHGQWRKKWEVNEEPLARDILSKEIISYLSKIMPKETIITTDVGQHQMFAAQAYNFKKAFTFCTSGGAGTMGFGLPAAIGAQVAYPGKKVVAISGDGGFQMTQEELILLTQYKLPVKVFIFNNGYLGMVRQWQELFHNKRYSYVELDYNPDFLILGQAYGIRGERVHSLDDLVRIKDFLLDDKPLIVEVVVPREDNVFPIIPAGKSIEDIIEGGK